MPGGTTRGETMARAGHPSLHAAVIGAGIVGAATALALLREGHRVTLIDPDPPGGPQAASFGNGAFLSPASIIPMSLPGLWRKVPGYLADPAGPLTIRWRHLPRLAPWLVRFLRSGAAWDRVQATAAALAALTDTAAARHAGLAASIGRPDLIRRDGLLYAFRERADYLAEAALWDIRRRHGLRIRELDAAALQALCPGLSPAYRFAVLVVDGGHCTDPGGYVAALVAAALAQGAHLHRGRATGFRLVATRLAAVRTDAAEIACDRAVIACGLGAARLARAVGDPVPLQAERGYHVEIASPPVGPRIPVMPQDGRMANVMTRTGLRAAGQVELAAAGAAPDWRRAEILLGHLKSTWPALAEAAELEVSRWQGNRPSTPDGLPVIGRARSSTDVIHAFGHGHIGLMSAPMTADCVAELIAGQPPGIDLTPFRAARFRWSFPLRRRLP